MTSPEIAQLEILAQADEIVQRVEAWTEEDSPSEPITRCRALLKRVLARVESLRIRLEAPLVVATFGGTGTGKSSLVNALVGRECARTGRQRPTTTRPVLFAHPQTDLAGLGFSLDEFEVQPIDAPLLRDIVLIDCPDPDTSEQEVEGNNLQRLHRLLPHCDVLIYTSTQQKYRSARVSDELGAAATGCRLLFVQTHADLDEDVRDDWRRHLAEHYEVPEVFFVDSLRGLKEQQAGDRPSGDVARLQDVLTSELSAAHRVQIRRGNLVDLIYAALDRCRRGLAETEPALQQLESVLAAQQTRLRKAMAVRLANELRQSSHLWERRLLVSVAQVWGFSPFSAMIRLYNALGGVIASLTLLRARSSAQVALIGAVQGFRWLRSRHQELAADSRVRRLTLVGEEDGLLREAQVLSAGYAKSAGIDPALAQGGSLDKLRGQAANLEQQFLEDASHRIDRVIDELVTKNSGWFVRARFEVLFVLYPVFLLARIGKNFFYDTLFLGADYLSTSFYLPALLLFVLWSWLLIAAFSRRLRRHLGDRIDEVSRSLADSALGNCGGLFPKLERACTQTRLQIARLEALTASVGGMKREIAIGSLGATLAAPRSLANIAAR